MMSHENKEDKNSFRKSKHAWYKMTLALFMTGVLVTSLLPLLLPADAQKTSTGRLDDAEFKLLITPLPPNLPSDGNTYHIMIQLLTATDEKPTESPYDIQIRLLSSDPSVISLPSSTVTLKEGETMIKAEITTTEKPGLASVTASTDGTQSSTVDINTISLDSLDPTKLAVYVAPESLIPDPKYAGFVYVQLLNSQGLPAVTEKSIAVSLSSSDSTIATVPSSTTISSGTTGILVSLTPGQNEGDAEITASAAGLSPGKGEVLTGSPVGTKLVIEFAPDVIAAEPYANTLMSVQLRDDNDVPVRAGKTISVELRSSNDNVLDTPLSIQILAGKSYATAFVDNRLGFAGEATVTATSPGLEAGFGTVFAAERSDQQSTSSEKKIFVYSAPSKLPPDNSEHSTIVTAFFHSPSLGAQLTQQSCTGSKPESVNCNPVQQSNHVYQDIVLSSSNSDVGTVDDSEMIAKTFYSVAKFKTHAVVGDTVITASLGGYSPAQFELSIAGSAPTTVALTQIPGVVQADGKSSNSLVVSLNDQDGRTVAAPKEVTVFLTSSDPEIATVVGSVTIALGKSHGVASVHTTLKPGQTIITGSSAGLDSGSVEFKTAGFTGSISAYTFGLYTIDKISADGKTHEAIVVQIQDQNGNPVSATSDVPVTLSSSSFTGGTVQSVITIPTGSNYAIATFTTTITPADGIVVTASSEGFSSVDAKFDSTVQELVVFRTGEIPRQIAYGATIPIIVDTFSAKNLPVKGATLSVVSGDKTETIGITDADGHAEGQYLPTAPGRNTLVATVSKPGYKDATIQIPVTVTKEISITVNAVSEAGKAITAEIKMTGPTKPRSDTTKPGAPITIAEAKFGTYILTPTAEIKSSEGTFNFVKWSDGSVANPRSISITDDTKLTAVYSAKYMLKIDSEQGTVTGGGLYPEGARASISISPTSVGGILIDKNFGGWTGDISSGSPSTDVVMNGSKTIKAIWTDSYLKVFLIIGAAGGGIFAYYWKVFKPKREAIQRDKAPDLDWFKS